MKTAVQEVVGMDVVRLVVGHVLALVGVAALAVVAAAAHLDVQVVRAVALILASMDASGVLLKL